MEHLSIGKVGVVLLWPSMQAMSDIARAPLMSTADIAGSIASQAVLKDVDTAMAEIACMGGSHIMPGKFSPPG